MVFGFHYHRSSPKHSWTSDSFPVGLPVMPLGYAYSYPSPYCQVQPTIAITSPPTYVPYPVPVQVPTPVMVPMAVPSPVVQTSAIAPPTTHYIVAQSPPQVPSPVVPQVNVYYNTPGASPDRRPPSPQPQPPTPSPDRRPPTPQPQPPRTYAVSHYCSCTGNTGNALGFQGPHQAQASGYVQLSITTPLNLLTSLPANLQQPELHQPQLSAHVTNCD